MYHKMEQKIKLWDRLQTDVIQIFNKLMQAHGNQFFSRMEGLG